MQTSFKFSLFLVAGALFASGLGGLSPTPDAAAEMKYVAESDKVAASADLVVRGTLDRKTNTLTVKQWFGPRLKNHRVVIADLDRLPQAEEDLSALGAQPVTDHVILFLRWKDHRASLFETASPSWIRPAASIIYLTATDDVRVYRQPINPGPLVPMKGDVGRKALEKQLTKQRAERTLPSAPHLSFEESKRFYALTSPWLDLDTGAVLTKKLGEQQATSLRTSLVKLARDAQGLLRRRAFEALFVLAGERGSPQTRREACEKALIELAKELGNTPVVAVAHELCSRDSTSANKRSAGAVLKAIGGKPRTTGRDLLLKGLVSEQLNVVTNAYWGLVAMGYEKEAKAAPRRKK